jgi:2-haloacid dehalogenase
VLQERSPSTRRFGFNRYKALTFDCYGTLIDWETGITDWVHARQTEIAVPDDLVLNTFALMGAKHQNIRPTLLYPEVLSRTWHDIESTLGWEPNPEHAELFASSAGNWLPFTDTIGSLRYLARFYKLGILSNVDNASLKGTMTRLEVPFDLTVTAEDVGSYKPNIAHFETALTRFADRGIARNEVLHVAQSKHHDVKPCRDLDLTCVWVDRRKSKKGSGANLVSNAEPNLTVVSLAELVKLHEAEATRDGCYAGNKGSFAC